MISFTIFAILICIAVAANTYMIDSLNKRLTKLENSKVYFSSPVSPTSPINKVKR